MSGPIWPLAAHAQVITDQPVSGSLADGAPARTLGLRFFVTSNTARAAHSGILTIRKSTFCRVRGDDNELQLSDEFQRVYTDCAYVGHLLDGAVDGHIEKLSQQLRPDPASRCLNRPCELSEIMSRAH